LQGVEMERRGGEQIAQVVGDLGTGGITRRALLEAMTSCDTILISLAECSDRQPCLSTKRAVAANAVRLLHS
jgi:hypothetical protein